MKRDKLLAACVALALPVLAGCGKWPPIVNDAGDIRRLPADEMSIRARGLSDSDVPALERLKALQNLDFKGGRAVKEAKITDRGLEALAALHLPSLTHLLLGYNANISDRGLTFLAAMSSLEHVSLAACPKITDEGLAYLAKHASFNGLDLRGCTGITDVGLSHLTSMKSLESLSLGGCPNISGEAVVAAQAAMSSAQVTKDDEIWEDFN